MQDVSPQTIYLNDYRPFGYHVDDVHLTFELSASATRVISRITFTPNTKFPKQNFCVGSRS